MKNIPLIMVALCTLSSHVWAPDGFEIEPIESESGARALREDTRAHDDHFRPHLQADSKNLPVPRNTIPTSTSHSDHPTSNPVTSEPVDTSTDVLLENLSTEDIEAIENTGRSRSFISKKPQLPVEDENEKIETEAQEIAFLGTRFKNTFRSKGYPMDSNGRPDWTQAPDNIQALHNDLSIIRKTVQEQLMVSKLKLDDYLTMKKLEQELVTALEEGPTFDQFKEQKAREEAEEKKKQAEQNKRERQKLIKTLMQDPTFGTQLTELNSLLKIALENPSGEITTIAQELNALLMSKGKTLLGLKGKPGSKKYAETLEKEIETKINTMLTRLNRATPDLTKEIETEAQEIAFVGTRFKNAFRSKGYPMDSKGSLDWTQTPDNIQTLHNQLSIIRKTVQEELMVSKLKLDDYLTMKKLEQELVTALEEGPRFDQFKEQKAREEAEEKKKQAEQNKRDRQKLIKTLMQDPTFGPQLKKLNSLLKIALENPSGEITTIAQELNALLMSKGKTLLGLKGKPGSKKYAETLEKEIETKINTMITKLNRTHQK